MLNTFSAETFQPFIGQAFRVRFSDGAATEITLVEVSATDTDTDPRRLRPPFRLVFTGPAGRAAPQAIYPVENDALGEMAIFLVPFSSDAQGISYEAIFS
jgi:hypothetical protein